MVSPIIPQRKVVFDIDPPLLTQFDLAVRRNISGANLNFDKQTDRSYKQFNKEMLIQS